VIEATSDVAARGGIPDNPRPPLSWTIVQNSLPEPIALCLHGDAPCSEAWIDEALAQAPPDSALVLLGPALAVLGRSAAARNATVDVDDPLAVLRAARAAAGDRDLVLLSSGTTLPPFAIARLLRALAARDVLAASPLDNLDAQRSPLPARMHSDAPAQRIDALCHAHAAGRLLDADRVSVLASAWRGDRLSRIADGDLPAAAAGRLRGSRVVMLDHLYVAAHGRALDGAPEDPDPRDPLPPSPLAELRRAIASALQCPLTPSLAGLDQRPVLLHILHGWGGGAERWVRDFSAGFERAHHRVLISRGSHARRRHGEWLELHDGAIEGPALRRIALPCPIADTAMADAGYRSLLDELVRDQRIDAIVVSSLIGHSLDVLRTGLPTLRVVHDHYPLWPVLHRDFGDPALAFDAAQRAADLVALGDDREFAATDPGYWKHLRDATVAALGDADVTLVAPSRSALADELRLAAELAALPSHVIGHGLGAWPRSARRCGPPPPRPRLRLAIPGRVRRGKGAELLQRVLPRLCEFADVFLLGAGADAHAFFGHTGVHIVLDYRREDLPQLLATVAPDATLLLPTVSETFGYTLSELRDLGLPVVATRVGAFAERIRDGVDGFLVDPTAEAIVTRLVDLAADRDAIARVRTLLADWREPDLASMADAYAPLLPATRRGGTRVPLDAADIAAQQLAAHATELDAALSTVATLTRQRDAALRENASRGKWGHALDRELHSARARIDALGADLDERTRWALDLDAEVNALRPYKPAWETVVGSRSWRLTAPLRTLASRLRGLRTRIGFRATRLLGLARRVRGSLARHGWRGTWTRILREWRGGARARPMQTVAPPDEAFTAFALATSGAPLVSIVIPVHNKFAYTAACLRSLGAHADGIAFEVIVVDDCSSDTTAERLVEIAGIRTIRNAQNLGFVGSCNAGAQEARGTFVLFLNNDTVVTSGWLAALLRCFDEEPDAGLVGAQLVYPDGRLQEAGGIVFNDASGWNYGRFEDPDDCRFAFRREADYCSGAAIMLRRELFERLGGFDQRYAPAYYEDTDLAFAVRSFGLKVFCEPASRVVHFEGITAGTDTGSGMKRFQIVNQEKFREKWVAALRAQPAPGIPIGIAATHRARRRVLIIDATTPTPDQDSGSLRMLNLMRVLRDSGCHVAFMPDNRAYLERYTDDLQRLGIEVLFDPWTPDPVRLFRERGAQFDAIVLSRHYVAASYVGLARLHAPQAKLIFDTVDLHYLRERRAAEFDPRPELVRQAASTRAQELRLMRDCDLTLVVSPVEKDILARDAPGVAIDVLSNVHEIHGRRQPFAARHDLVFVGGFQHPPNTDAVLWFVAEVFPRVRAALPEVRFHVIGSKVPEAIRALDGDGVTVHGFVDDIAPFMDDCRISVAPLRYGAGVKGKVNMAMSYGLPVVATTMAVEGMHVRAGEDVLVADSAHGFADAVIALYADHALWNRLSDNGLANVREHFSFEAASLALRRIIG